MHKNFELSLTTLLCMFLLVSCSNETVEEPQRQFKNIIFIVADDLGWSDVGLEDSSIHTPNIDRLARSGVLLNQSYVYPLCTPSRSSFLSGRYAERTGMQHQVILPRQPYGLPTNIELLPQTLKKFGYVSHAIGKWHLGSCGMKYTPVNRGFDTFYGNLNGQADYYSHRLYVPTIFDNYDGLDYWNQTADYMEPVLDKNDTYSLFTYTERAIELFEKQQEAEEPFFVYFAPQNAHTPLQVPAEYEERYKHIQNQDRRKYLGMVTALDEAIGNLTQALDRLGLTNDTVIFFSSDNGGAVYADGRNFPLRGGKASVFEGGTRVKSFVNGQDLKPSVYNGMFHAVDWMPTILNAAVGEQVDVTGIDGINQWPSLTQNVPGQRTSFIYNIDPAGAAACGSVPTEAIRFGDWKLINGCPGISNWHEILDETLPNIFNKLTGLPKPNPSVYLFNIKNDPFETQNLADRYPILVKVLTAKIEAYKLLKVKKPLNTNIKPVRRSNPKHFGDTWYPGWC